MTGSEVAEHDKGGELEQLPADEQALVEGIKSRVDPSELILPAIKLTQSLTKEVTEGEAEAGVYVNSLTKKDYGDDVPFIVCGFYKGRFYSDDSGTYVARGDTAPDNWPEEYASWSFADIPDAEEQWKADTDAGKHAWESGPPIATTHNFVGFVVDDDSELPVRLSLMRSSRPAADRLKTMAIFSLRAPWDRVFRLKAKQARNKQDQSYYVVEVAQGDVPSEEDRQRAVQVATTFQRAEQTGAIQETGDEAEGSKAKPRAKKKDALDVD